MKRVFDVIASLVGLVILAPLLVVVAARVKRSSPGPVLHRARRVGVNGRLFTLYKFRSMVANADRVGAGITAQNDLRITPIGRVLRRNKLDELPQLINVLRGDMSLVGPRPEDPHYVALYTADQRRVLSVRPGITSWASIQYRYEEQMLSAGGLDEIYQTVIMPQKLRLDLQYVEHISLALDLKIIIRTFLVLFES